jgi:hypothetical protein
MQAKTSVRFEEAVPQPRPEVTLNQASLPVAVSIVPKPLIVPDSWIKPATIGSDVKA